MVITTKELFANGNLVLSRKETHGNSKQTKSEPGFTSRMEKREYYNENYFNIRNVLDIKGFLKDIRDNWDTYVSLVKQWVQKSPVKKLVVTGIFTIVLGFLGSSVNAAGIQEYTYQIKSGDTIEKIAAAHGVTAQEILDANGLTSIDGKKILLPIVNDRTVTATLLHIRSHPNTESSIIGTFKKGDVIKVVYVENGWAGILIKGRLCFVSADYLTKNSPAPAPTNTQNGIVQDNSSSAYSSVYVIRKGDTFTKIGKALGISVVSLQDFNPTVDCSKLQIGQKIKIPAITAADTNQIKVTAQIGGVDPQGTFRFITSDGRTYTAKALGNMLNELYELEGKKVTLTLTGKRGQQMTLLSLQ